MKCFSRFLLTSSLILLSACSGDDVRSTIGLERTTPDEFRVVSRPPLSVPPEFSLRPPLDGIDEVSQLPSDKLTRSMITGTSADFGNTLATKADGTPVVDTAVMPVESGNAPSGAESELLTRLGADRKESDIRSKIVADHITRQKEKEDEWFSVDALNPFAKDKDSLDATEEVRKLKDEGKPVLGKHLVPDDKEETKKAEPKKEESAPEEKKTETPKIEEKQAEEKKASESPPDVKKDYAKKPEEKRPEERQDEKPAAQPSTQDTPHATLKDVIDNKASDNEADALVNLGTPEDLGAPEPAASDVKPEAAKAEDKKPEDKKVDEKAAPKAETAKPAAAAPAPKYVPSPSAVDGAPKMPNKIIVK